MHTRIPPRITCLATIFACAALTSCSDSNDDAREPVRLPGPGPAPVAQELVMDLTTPAPGIPLSFPDGVAVFEEADGEWVYFNEGNRQRRVLVSSIGTPSLIN